jgi:S1-C subfamily serine protease
VYIIFILNVKAAENIFSVEFLSFPLGFTISVSHSGDAEVTKVVSGGQAERQGIMVGDVVIGRNRNFPQKFDEVMELVRSTSFPLTLHLRRGFLNTLSKTTSDMYQDSKVYIYVLY